MAVWYKPTKEEMCFTKGIEYRVLDNDKWVYKSIPSIVYLISVIEHIRIHIKDYEVKALGIDDLQSLLFKNIKPNIWENDDYVITFGDEDKLLVKDKNKQTLFHGYIKNKAELINELSKL